MHGYVLLSKHYLKSPQDPAQLTNQEANPLSSVYGEKSTRLAPAAAAAAAAAATDAAYERNLRMVP